jgi:alkanesulfonate monooxygenase SsuD/methylene tetrahydromethanopterin reductase-like flavin-dependent oxidoreductase (luciferase family)
MPARPQEGAPVKFGVLYDLRNPARPDWFRPWPEFYGGALEHMEEMERAGFDALSLAEHHGDPDGYDPGIMVAMTAAAMRTKRVRIGSNIIQLPYRNPVLLAEELAVLDVVSGGRLDVGLGQVAPTFDMEFRMLGVNPKQRTSLMDEGIEILLRAWTEDEPFDFRGKRWSLEGVWINPKPLQKPHPPTFLVGAFSEQAMDRVARFGLDVGAKGGYFTSLTGREVWTGWLASWREACAKRGRDPESVRINTFGSCFVTDDPEKAWAKHREGALATFHYERQGVHPYTALMMETPPREPEDVPNWQRLFCTPEQAIAEIREVYAAGAPDELHLMASRAGMSWEESATYLRNFAEKVIPAVRDL